MSTLGFDFFVPRQVPQQIISTRVLINKPVARNQWMIWLKRDGGDEPLPEFELGNFCMLSLPELIDPLIPRPFAIAEANDGAYGFIYRIHGKQTRLLSATPVGSRVEMVGPLGQGIARSHFQAGEHIFVAGGVGFASLLPLSETVGAQATSQFFYGVRSDLEVIRRGSVNAEMASDDGTIGHRGRLHDVLKLKKFSKDAWFYVCGPTPMMKACWEILPQDRSLYFLEETMGCGFGICVGCVVPITRGDDTKHYVKSCLEGPMFLGSALKLWAREVA